MDDDISYMRQLVVETIGMERNARWNRLHAYFASCAGDVLDKMAANGGLSQTSLEFDALREARRAQIEIDYQQPHRRSVNLETLEVDTTTREHWWSHSR